MTVGSRQVLLCALLAMLALPAVVLAQFTFVTNADNTITITGYTDDGGAVIIPGQTNGLPVRSIGHRAFWSWNSITSVTIPDSVTNAGGHAFEYCHNLTSMTIPDGVTSIASDLFADCSRLGGVIIGRGVTNIDGQAFVGCTSLTGVCFRGNAPSLGEKVFGGDDKATIYHLPNTTGWGKTFGGRPTALWKPQTNAPTAAGIIP